MMYANHTIYPSKIEIIGSHQSIDDLAKDAKTIPYEILTSLGARYKRVYKKAT